MSNNSTSWQFPVSFAAFSSWSPQICRADTREACVNKKLFEIDTVLSGIASNSRDLEPPFNHPRPYDLHSRAGFRIINHHLPRFNFILSTIALPYMRTRPSRNQYPHRVHFSYSPAQILLEITTIVAKLDAQRYLDLRSTWNVRLLFRNVDKCLFFSFVSVYLRCKLKNVKLPFGILSIKGFSWF